MQFISFFGAFIVSYNAAQHKTDMISTKKVHSFRSTAHSSQRNRDDSCVPSDRDSISPLPERRRRIRRSKRRNRIIKKEDQSPILSDSIDSFLAGDYAHPFAPDAPAPHPLLSAGKTVDASLRALRQMNDPYPCHGAAVFLRFCMPLTRGERLGGDDPWKDILRSSLTPAMLARNIRASPQFSCLLDWTSLDVTEGVSNLNPSFTIAGSKNDVTYVNAGLFFEYGAPKIVHFVLRKVGTAWFIDSIIFGTEESKDWSFDMYNDDLFS